MQHPQIPTDIPVQYRRLVHQYGRDCVHFYRESVKANLGKLNMPKYGPEEAREVREMHAEGLSRKIICRKFPMTETTYYNILHRRGAYASQTEGR